MFDSRHFDEANGDGPSLSDFIQQTDEARAVPCPDDVDELWVEKETEEAEQEQLELHDGLAEEETEDPKCETAALEHPAEKARERSDAKHGTALAARSRFDEDGEVLGRLKHRGPHALFIYWVRLAVLLAGDAAGFTGAALLLGDPIYIALAQGLSAGLSALIFGGIGKDARHILDARLRQKAPDQLVGKELQYARWFAGPTMAESLIKIIALLCLAGILLFTVGIFTLREAAVGSEVAIAYGCFALALGLASAYNSFDTVDEVADYLAASEADVEKADKSATKASHNPVIAKWRSAQVRSKSIESAIKARGRGAARGLRRRLYRVLNENPGVAGNGPAARPIHKPGENGNGNGGKP